MIEAEDHGNEVSRISQTKGLISDDVRKGNEAVVQDLWKQQVEHRKGLTLTQRPLETLKYFGLAIQEQLLNAIIYFARSRWLLGSATVILLTFGFLVMIDGPHESFVMEIMVYLQFSLWWMCLGIASSIGLGSGLHTFVLYLGPHLARFTLKATACGRLDLKSAPYDTIQWGKAPSWGNKDCSEFGPALFPHVLSERGGYYRLPLHQLVYAVQLEAILWGIGTAIGELPPYFVSRAARLSGERVKELDEFDKGRESSESGLFFPLKKWMFLHAHQLGFFAILGFASIPNPLFDLAGITCGHFLVPFWKFFSATLIGKSIVKTHMQMIFILAVFNSHSVEVLESYLETLLSWTPLLSKQVPVIMAALDEAREKLSGRSVKKQSSLINIASIWNTFVMLMLAAFLASIISSTARGYLIEEQRKNLKSLQVRLREDEQDSALIAQLATAADINIEGT